MVIKKIGFAASRNTNQKIEVVPELSLRSDHAKSLRSKALFWPSMQGYISTTWGG